MEGSGACKPPHAAQASSQPSPCVFSGPPVPIRKEVEGNNLVWPLFLLPQGWQWDSKVPLWLDKATTNASSAGTSALQLTVPSLDRGGLPPSQPVSTRRCEAVANRSCSCGFPNTN